MEHSGCRRTMKHGTQTLTTLCAATHPTHNVHPPASACSRQSASSCRASHTAGGLLPHTPPLLLRAGTYPVVAGWAAAGWVEAGWAAPGGRGREGAVATGCTG